MCIVLAAIITRTEQYDDSESFSLRNATVDKWISPAYTFVRRHPKWTPQLKCSNDFGSTPVRAPVVNATVHRTDVIGMQGARSQSARPRITIHLQTHQKFSQLKRLQLSVRRHTNKVVTTNTYRRTMYCIYAETDRDNACYVMLRHYNRLFLLSRLRNEGHTARLIA